MKTLPQAEILREIFDYDAETGVIRWRRRPAWHFSSAKYAQRVNSRFEGKVAGSLATNGYLRVNIGNRFFLNHRIIWAMTHGSWPSGEIDHINGDRADNRISNLRLVGRDQNARNIRRPTTNTSGVVGVSFNKRDNSWHAYIGVGGGKRRSLGHFKTAVEAIHARSLAETSLGYHQNHGRPA